MKLLIDVQPLQTVGSSKRGIGRYSLNILKKLSNTNDGHEIILLANRTLSSIDDLNQTLVHEGILFNVLEWSSPQNSMYLTAPEQYRKISQDIYREILLEANPDVHFILSSFEGLGDELIWATHDSIPSASIFYDAIPKIFENHYLVEKSIRSWYHSTVADLQRVNALISISESAKVDADLILGLQPAFHIVVNAGLDDRSLILAEQDNSNLTPPVNEDFIFTVLGEDFRKNKQNLLLAFKELTANPDFRHNLVVAYKQSEHEKNANLKLIQQLRLSSRVLFLDYVSDVILYSYYKKASLFVFPSLYEGLGLPILEAQACGIPTLAGNTSGMRELFNSEKFLFDPTDPADIAFKITNILSNSNLRSLNIREGKHFVKAHSNLEAGEKIWQLFEELANQKPDIKLNRLQKPRLAFFTPLPPQKSGIGTHGTEILPYLNEKFELTVFTDNPSMGDLNTLRLRQSISSNDKFQPEDFDVLIYNIGNSEFHTGASDILAKNPGIVILHDVFLSGLAWMKLFTTNQTSKFAEMLYKFGGVNALCSLFFGEEHQKILERHSLNSFVLQKATKVIVHSHYAKGILLSEWTHLDSNSIHVLPQQHGLSSLSSTQPLVEKTALSFATFGAVAETKMYRKVLQAWKGSKPQLDGVAKLFFVGEDLTYDLTELIVKLKLQDSVEVTGYLEDIDYASYLMKVDVGIQLRQSSRGETSRALLDLFAAGKPVIINENGSFGEYNEYGILKLSDKFRTAELREYINILYSDFEMRNSLGNLSILQMRDSHSPHEYVEKLADLIEADSTASRRYPERVARRLVSLYKQKNIDLSDENIDKLLNSLTQSFKHNFYKRRVYLDVTSFQGSVISDVEFISLRAVLVEISKELHFLDIRFVVNLGADAGFIDNPNFLCRIFDEFSFNLPSQRIELHDLTVGFWPFKIIDSLNVNKNLVKYLELAVTLMKEKFLSD